MIAQIGFAVLLGLICFAVGAGMVWLYLLADQAAFKERQTAAATETQRVYRWLREKDERYAKLASECEALRIANAEWQTAASVEKESLERERSAYEADRKRLEETFRSIGSQIIDSNVEKLTTVTRAMFEHHRLSASIELEQLISPVSQTLTKLEEEIRVIEFARTGDREALKAGVELLGKLLGTWRANAQEIGNGTTNRGREVTIKRDPEIADPVHPQQKAFQNPMAAEIGATLREYSSPTNRFAVRFQYPNPKDQTLREREVEPYGVFERFGTYSLIGYDRARKAWRIFDIAKIASQPLKAGKCTNVRMVPEQYAFTDSDDSFVDDRQGDVTLALTSKAIETALPRHADGGKSVNNSPAGVGR